MSDGNTHAIISTPIVSEEQWHQLRAPNVGCSEVGALFGVHDYLTAYGLAARKLGLIEPQADNPAMKRGRELEPVAIKLLAEQRPDWQQISASNYYEDSELRFGATPDLFVKREDGAIGIVQIKSVTPGIFADKWRASVSGAITPPLWIALQAMGEQHLTGSQFAYVAALVVDRGLHLELVEIPYLPNVIEEMRRRVRDFWRLVDAGKLPDPDYGLDRDILAQVLREDDGAEIDLTSDNELPEICARLERYKLAKKTAEDAISECQAKILHRIGTAQRAKIAGGMIMAKTTHRAEHVVKATSFRQLRVKLDRVAVQDE